ncbi:MAG: GTP 3',8-cyclase MoaA [Treponema sp.]|nr:GTP 3',8-cyclase MoaA [Treponema sp.]
MKNQAAKAARSKMNDIKTGRKILTDSFGRKIDYLRLSITDRCNLRCLYCMPPEGVDSISHNEILRFEELLKLCRIFADIGIDTVRVTGGEPLIRKGAVDFIRELKAINGIKRVTMTSNGVLLGEHLKELSRSELDAVNISLDTLDREKFSFLTRGGTLGNILSAIDLALELALEVKINCVPLRGFNEDDIPQIASLAKNRKITVRFIELMPLGAASSMKGIAETEVFTLIEKKFGCLEPLPFNYGSGPASYYTLDGFSGNIGIISAVSRRFCEKCNRLRLSASGALKPCLSGSISADLRGLLRNNASDENIADVIRKLAADKPAGHNFNFNDYSKKIEMFRIGG